MDSQTAGLLRCLRDVHLAGPGGTDDVDQSDASECCGRGWLQRDGGTYELTPIGAEVLEDYESGGGKSKPRRRG